MLLFYLHTIYNSISFFFQFLNFERVGGGGNSVNGKLFQLYLLLCADDRLLSANFYFASFVNINVNILGLEFQSRITGFVPKFLATHPKEHCGWEYNLQKSTLIIKLTQTLNSLCNLQQK